MPPSQPGIATAASPSRSLAEVELTPNPSLPLVEDIMQCARIGALEHIQKMLQSGKHDAKYKDEEGITPLHVRSNTQVMGAISNHV
jgi:ankyrin repeat protein